MFPDYLPIIIYDRTQILIIVVGNLDDLDSVVQEYFIVMTVKSRPDHLPEVVNMRTPINEIVIGQLRDRVILTVGRGCCQRRRENVLNAAV